MLKTKVPTGINKIMLPQNSRPRIQNALRRVRFNLKTKFEIKMGNVKLTLSSILYLSYDSNLSSGQPKTSPEWHTRLSAYSFSMFFFHCIGIVPRQFGCHLYTTEFENNFQPRLLLPAQSQTWKRWTKFDFSSLKFNIVSKHLSTAAVVLLRAIWCALIWFDH